MALSIVLFQQAFDGKMLVMVCYLYGRVKMPHQYVHWLAYPLNWNMTVTSTDAMAISGNRGTKRDQNIAKLM